MNVQTLFVVITASLELRKYMAYEIKVYGIPCLMKS